MPRPKSKRKTSRPSPPSTRQAPQSAGLARLANDTVAQGMELVGADRAADAIALADGFLDRNRAVADVLHLRGYAKVMLERTEDALEDFRKAVKLDPDTPAYRNSLGIAAQMAGDHEQARRQFRRACQLDVGNPTYWFNLGNALRDLGAAADAAEAYEAALAHRPDDSEILNNLGVVLRDDGRVDEAVDAFRRAHTITEREPQILANLGIALLECPDRDAAGEAEGLLKSAIARSPSADRAGPLKALMQLYVSVGKGAQAVAVARQLATLAKDDLPAQATLAEVLIRAGMADEAIAITSELHSSHPSRPELIIQHVRCLVGALRYDEALSLTHQILHGEPKILTDERNILQIVRWRFESLFWNDRIDEFLEELDRADTEYPDLPLKDLFRGRAAFIEDDPEKVISLLSRQAEDIPDDPVIRVELATHQLAAGRLVEGWTNYRYRHESGKGSSQSRSDADGDDAGPLPLLPVPDWRGESLTGKRLFIMAEQGVGDEVMFASCIPDVVAQADHCIIECDPRLVPLFARSFPDATVHPAIKSMDFSVFYRAYAWLKRKGGADLATASGDLPLYLRTQKSDFDRSKPFLKPRADRVAFWRQRFSDVSEGRPIVGISWQGSLTNANRLMNYQDLGTWAPILSDTDFCFVNLQSRRFETAIRSAQDRHGLKVAYWNDIDLHNDFDEAAAYVAALDAAIAPITFMAQLAGGVGTKTYVPMSGRSWGCCGFPDRIPFYSNVRAVRRRPGSSWVPAMHQIAHQIAADLRSEPQSRAASTVP